MARDQRFDSAKRRFAEQEAFNLKCAVRENENSWSNTFATRDYTKALHDRAQLPEHPMPFAEVRSDRDPIGRPHAGIVQDEVGLHVLPAKEILVQSAFARAIDRRSLGDTCRQRFIERLDGPAALVELRLLAPDNVLGQQILARLAQDPLLGGFARLLVDHLHLQ